MIVELLTGCDTTEEEPSVYSGPPTADATDDATEGVDAVSDVPEQSDTGPVVYYGPQPVDARAHRDQRPPLSPLTPATSAQSRGQDVQPLGAPSHAQHGAPPTASRSRCRRASGTNA